MRLIQPLQCVRFAGTAALVLVLGSCATLAEEPAAPDYDESMAMAWTHVAADQPRAAITALQQAAMLEPARKEPWLEIARLRAGQGRHIDALSAAEQVLRRDPADPAAADVALTSGLEVARQMMQRLRAGGQVPSERQHEQAQAIAVLMVEVFGPEFLVPAEVKTQLAQAAVEQYKAIRAAQLPDAQKEEPKGDPFDLLGED